MNSLIKILFIAVTLLRSMPAQDCTADVLIETNKKTSRIYIDNEFSGTGTITKELGKGTYSLLVIEDSITWNPKSYRDTITITDCSSKKFNYNFNSSVYLRSEPEDIYVFSNDSLIGHTPLYLSTGLNNLRLSKPGYEEKVVSSDEIAQNNIIRLNPLIDEDNELFIQKDVFKYLVGSAVVLGGLTAYFKLKADDYFEEYETTGSPDMLDKTRTNDLISGITFSALQINFGILIYYFLTD